MIQISAYIAHLFNRKNLTYLANKADGPIELVEMIAATVLTPLSNEVLASRKSTWVEIAPYGRHRHSAGMQIFEREDAAEVVREFANSRKFSLFGLPWYIGHPDHPAFKDRYKDGRSYGRIKELRVGATGLEARLKLGAKGVQIVNEEEFDGHSPNWGCIKDSAGNYRPRKLMSCGWTNEANIDVKPIMPGMLANAKDGFPGEEKFMLKQHVKETFLASGLIKPGATEEQIDTVVQNLANEIPGLRKEAAKVADLSTQLTTLKDELSETQTTLANERKDLAGTVVDMAIEGGRLETGKRDEAIENLANEKDFSSASKLILDAEPKFKTSSKTDGLGQRSATDAGVGQQITALCNEKTAAGMSWDDAYESVKSSHPQLFEA